MSAADLKKLAKQFEQNYPVEKLTKAEELHRQFLTEFPVENLENMSLEKYALGTSEKNNFCWWLEYNTIPLGSIKGGDASKLIIYYSVKDREWKYPAQFGSELEAWEKLRSAIIEVIESYQDEPFKPIADDNLLYRANMLKGKVLYMYHPDKVLPIYSLAHLQHFLKQLGVPEEKWKGKDNVECNLLLKETLYSMDIFKDWPLIKAGDFLYEKMLKKIKYYKIAPGPDAVNWEQCRNGNFISIGWPDIGDLSRYPDYEEFLNAYHEHTTFGSPAKTTEKANELWLFYNLQPGDKVLVNKGKSQVLAVGTVTEEAYQYRENFEGYKHIVNVQWDHIYDPPLNIERKEYWGVKTVLELKEKEFAQIIEGKVIDIPPAEESFFERLEKALERKGQCILYGPPGTGKTYLARKFIKWKNNKEKLGQHPDTPSQKLWMMVASKKEDFQWENILSNNGVVDYSLRTITTNFKKAQKGDKVLCYRGGDVNRAFVGIGEIKEPFNGEYLLVRGIKSFKEPIEFDQVKDAVEYKTSQPGRMGNRGTMFEVSEDLEQWFVDYLYENGDADSAELLSEAAKKNNFEMCTFHPSFNYEDFIEGYKPVQGDGAQVVFQLEKGLFARLCERAREYSPRPFFLIIDEINRGNIPKIFGEVITLLEKDKRGVEVVLPQSKVSFTVPENLYIIGTMNTADRSIKIMDAALKRRFAFIECMPDLSLISRTIDELNLSPADILSSINKRLIAYGGRDKQIGHSYFMKNGSQINTVAELKEIFEHEIIPLVQEYCFDDYHQLAEIIGPGFVSADEFTINHKIFHEPDDMFITELNKHFQGVTDEETD